MLDVSDSDVGDTIRKQMCNLHNLFNNDQVLARSDF